MRNSRLPSGSISFVTISFVAIILAVVSLHLSALQAGAQSPLRTMSSPQGGTIVFGTVDGANTPPAAMGSVLSNLHKQYGDRPVVGRMFRVRGTNSDAVFFTATRRSPSTLKMAGMLLVSSAQGHVEAAVLSDTAEHLGTSINPMLQTLFANWKPGGKDLLVAPVGVRTTPAADSEPVARMHPYRLQDNSASVMLPDGWNVAAAQSGGGTILAKGAHGELVSLGFAFSAYDPRNPQVQQSRNFAMSPAGRNTIYAKNLYVPYGADLGRTLLELNSQATRVNIPRFSPLQLDQTQQVRSNGSTRCAIVSGSSVAQATLLFEGTICQSPLMAGGSFMNIVNLSFAPPALASRERATLRAILASFQVNNAVVNAQAAAIAQPGIDAIHQIGRDVTARIAASDRQMDERRSSFEAHNDAMDRSSQGFSNYILDKSVILDNQNNAHGSMWNNAAATLVQSDPKRFEYVDTPGYWKGIDY